MDARRRDLAKIHLARKDLGLDEDAYRQLLSTFGGAPSAADLSATGRARVLAHFKHLGWRPKGRNVSPASRHKRPGQKTQTDKIRALWIEMHRAGIVRDRSERALARFVYRITGKHSPDWLDAHEANQVIETLKQWAAREELKPRD